MRRMLVLLLLAALLLSACSELTGSDRQIQPVTFYYRTVETDFSAEDGLIRREVREAEAQHQKQMNPEAGNKNPASAVFRGNAHPSMGRHSFSHVRRFVPRKKTGKRPEGSTQ